MKDVASERLETSTSSIPSSRLELPIRARKVENLACASATEAVAFRSFSGRRSGSIHIGSC